MTGYDLSRSYRRALQQIWYAPLGQVYPTLRKMRRDGLLRVSVKVQRHRPNRKIYTLTAEGPEAAGAVVVANGWRSRACITSSFTSCFNSVMSKQPAAASWSRSISSAASGWAMDLRRAEAMLEPSLKGPNAENAWFQLLSLRHLRRIVECEAESARQIAEEIHAPIHSTSRQRPHWRAGLKGKYRFCWPITVAHRLDHSR